MDTRILYSIAAIFVFVVGGFYYLSGKNQKLDSSRSQNLNSTATGIVVTQTRENGQLYAKATADTLLQNLQANQAEVKKLKGQLFQDGHIHATFTAEDGIASNNYQDFELFGGVVLNKISDDKAPSLTLQTERLQGNSETDEIKTDQLVKVSSPQAQFTSQGFKGNLKLGQYEFFTIRGRYEPAQ